MDDNNKENGVIGIEAASVTDNNTLTNNSTQENIELGADIPPGREQERKEIINRISGLEFNINHIIGAGIFIIPSTIWRLVQSPGTALMFWLAGGLISLLGSTIYVELGSRCPKGSGEQKYLEEAFNDQNKPADSYACAKYFLYAVKGNYENEDIYLDSIPLRLLAIAILFVITLYHMLSNRWAIIINRMFAIFKSIAILFVSIYGFANAKNQLTFNNTPSDEAYEPSIIEHIGSHGNSIVLILFTYEDLTEELKSPNVNLKFSGFLSVIVSSILYLMINTAFILVVSPHDAINSYDVIAINFGRTLWGDSGRIFMSMLISFSAFGCVSSMVFMGSRAITYAAKYGFIPKISDKLFYWNQTFNTPFYALLLQFCYCAALILFIAVGQSFFVFFAEMSLYSAILFYGVGAVCLLKLKKYHKGAQYQHFKVWKIFVWIYLLCTAFIAVAPFFPIRSSKYEPLNYKSFVPFFASWIPILISVSIWYLHDYKKVFNTRECF
ncbi:1965_t:CDS:10 [Cetraspora pellucida]|uniref:1965_t:CDS:1 n=1 Tax=Cetraspora pellucida TaxID=1433469 RepID=A0A9N9C2S3_9GLOM|nr:1965_t:CDS:10 [Cetraspora pellucida]